MRFHPTRELEACLISLRCLDGPSRHFHLAKTKCTEWLPKVHRRAMFRLTGACRVSICIWNINYLKMQAYCNTIYISKPGMYTITDSPLALLNSLRRRWREIQSHNITHIHTRIYIYIYVHHIVQSLAAKDLLVLVSQLAPVGLVLLPLSSATLRRQCSEVRVILGCWNEDFPHYLPFIMTPQWTPNVFKCNCDYVDIFMASKFMI